MPFQCCSPQMFRTVRLYLSEIKVAHTIFAMPFAIAGATLAFAERADATLPFIIEKLILIIAAMFAARSAAMMFNRIVDIRCDAANPRTSGRALVSGRISKTAAWAFVVCMSAIFITAAMLLNALALILSPLALAIVLGYSLTKRFTSMTHLFLGLSLALAPMGGWIGVLGSFRAFEVPALMAGAVLLWVAGFDIIYACQDYQIDLAAPLHSLPKSLGIRNALFISALLHAGTIGFLIALLAASGRLGTIFAIGNIVVAVILLAEHLLVRPNDLSRIGTAFLTLNGIVSGVVMFSVILDVIF